MALILSRFLYSHWENVFFAFPFLEFESVQTIKLIVSSKIQKLHKAAKWLQCNWDFMNKIDVKI